MPIPFFIPYAILTVANQREYNTNNNNNIRKGDL